MFAKLKRILSWNEPTQRRQRDQITTDDKNDHQNTTLCRFSSDHFFPFILFRPCRITALPCLFTFFPYFFFQVVPLYLCIFIHFWHYFHYYHLTFLICGLIVCPGLSCVADEGRSAVQQAGGAQLVAEHIKCLSLNTEPANEKLLTVFCGVLMNYSNDNGNDLLPGPAPKRQRFVLHLGLFCFSRVIRDVGWQNGVWLLDRLLNSATDFHFFECQY